MKLIANAHDQKIFEDQRATPGYEKVEKAYVCLPVEMVVDLICHGITAPFETLENRGNRVEIGCGANGIPLW